MNEYWDDETCGAYVQVARQFGEPTRVEAICRTCEHCCLSLRAEDHNAGGAFAHVICLVKLGVARCAGCGGDDSDARQAANDEREDDPRWSATTIIGW